MDNDKEYVLAPHIEKINNTFNGKTLEDIYRNLEKDGSEWASKTLATLQKMVSQNLYLSLISIQLRYIHDMLISLTVKHLYLLS